MILDNIEIWMLCGFAMILIELTLINGFGFLFLGLGALSVSIILSRDAFVDMTIYQQIIAFLVITALWFGLLWHPLKKYVYATKLDSKVDDIIGSEVVVIKQDISQGMIGQVKWSGTIMNAMLDDTNEVATIGSKLVVKQFQGTTLICVKK